MAIKRRQLAHRIADVGGNTAAAMGGYHPAGGPGTVQVMPLQHVQIVPMNPGYSTVAYQDITPIWTTDGAAVPATAPGSWGQLRAAGRP